MTTNAPSVDQLREAAQILDDAFLSGLYKKLNRTTEFSRTHFDLLDVANLLEEEAKPKPPKVALRNFGDGYAVYIEVPGQNRVVAVSVGEGGYSNGTHSQITLPGSPTEWGTVIN